MRVGSRHLTFNSYGGVERTKGRIAGRLAGSSGALRTALNGDRKLDSVGFGSIANIPEGASIMEVFCSCSGADGHIWG